MDKQFWRAVCRRPICLLIPLFKTNLLKWIPDEPYLRLQYRVITGKKLNLDPPRTFNEKIQWLKLHDRHPLRQIQADKYAVRPFVAEIIGSNYLVPLLRVWDRAEDIDFSVLPERFALKCTHGYGGMVLCRDKAKLDQEQIRKQLAKTAATDFFPRGREWAYGQAEVKIIAEELIDDGGGARPADYKFMCFNGRVRLICVSRSLGDRAQGCVSFFWPDGTRAPFKRADYPDYPGEDVLPDNLEELRQAAEALSRASAAPFIRVDFYVVGEKAYFSEFTFYPCGGTMFLEPPEYDRILGDMLHLD